MLYEVTVYEIGGEDYMTRVRAENARDAQEKGLAKLFGSRSFWKRDPGIQYGNYGQVFRPMEALGYKGDFNATSRTKRAQLTVVRVSTGTDESTLPAGANW